MGRYMPVECQHGTTIDWGDFGAHQSFEDCERDGLWGRTGCAVCYPPCEACGAQGAIEWAAAVERMRTVRAYVMPEIRHMSDEDALLFVLAAPPSLSTKEPRNEV